MFVVCAGAPEDFIQFGREIALLRPSTSLLLFEFFLPVRRSLYIDAEIVGVRVRLVIVPALSNLKGSTSNMTPSEYSSQAIKTAAGEYGSIYRRLSTASSIDVLHAALGMASEAGEVLEVVGFGCMDEWDKDTLQGLIAEIGDCCWYLNLACSCVWKKFDDFNIEGLIFDPNEAQMCLEDSSLKLCLYSSTFCDMVKASIFYGRELRSESVIPVLEGFYTAIVLACFSIGVTLESVLEKNILKLRARYGDAFSEQRANTRDLSIEKEAYSK
jgi:hypothetical protein